MKATFSVLMMNAKQFPMIEADDYIYKMKIIMQVFDIVAVIVLSN